MAVLTGKNVLKPYIKKATGYIKSLLSSQHVEMDNGKTLQFTIDEISNILTNKYSYEQIGNTVLKFERGVLMQWGAVTLGKASSAGGIVTSTVTLVTPFYNNQYHIFLSPYNNGNVTNSYWAGDGGGNDARTTNSFQVGCKNQSTIYEIKFVYLAIGRWK